MKSSIKTFKIIGIDEERSPTENASTFIKYIKKSQPDLYKLLMSQWTVKQNPSYHPEGNTLKHILVVLSRAFNVKPIDINLVLAALFHDLGKLKTYAIDPKKNQPTAYGHEKVSGEIVDKYSHWINTFEGGDSEKVKYIVVNHMKMKPQVWDVMADKKKDPIISNPAFKDLKKFSIIDKGGRNIDLKELFLQNVNKSISKTFKKFL
jgi:hypothetical protein